MFVLAIALLYWQMENPDGFNTIWQWFGWANQTLAVITLWTITVYLVLVRKAYWATLIPALFMTMVCTTYIFISPKALGLGHTLSYALGGVATIVAAIAFAVWFRKQSNNK